MKGKAWRDELFSIFFKFEEPAGHQGPDLWQQAGTAAGVVS